MKAVGVMALLGIISHFGFIILAFMGLQTLRLDRYFMKEQQAMFKLVLIMLAVTIGFGCSSFFLSFIDNVRNLSFLF
ncbi:DUF1146 family protein [Ligilactobacillus saerimneri]|uniref:DUF1146 family protein n=1 Tax=Ligilactobacillus saerimneri TaxID=228229 RepID=UPI000429B8CB|nr:DUF1146 family protein [Ligilactobacillus saerimneri]KRL71861.1 hypothetical protein FC54_GL001308 [Ligilactobacillus saerimneri DSM 16049]MDI9205878.1 DUF1146 family protein [Ligilactobacillus saerimneri]